jgi:hypothetical protein
MIANNPLSPNVEQVSGRILTVRGLKVILDSDLAALYGVTTKSFNQQVRRNSSRFPADFMFQLSGEDADNLRSQIVTSRSSHGGRRYLPHVFTEHGAIMAASILNSQAAIEMSVFVVRAFVELRRALASHQELTQRLNELEERIEAKLSTHDRAIAELFSAIRNLMSSPERRGRPIGFVRPGEQ